MFKTYNKNKSLCTLQEIISVEKTPPKYPSHVFFGKFSLNLNLPKMEPNMYPKISLQQTKMTGIRNQINPSYKLITESDV